MQLTQLELNPVFSATTHGTGCKSIAGLPWAVFVRFPFWLARTNKQQPGKQQQRYDGKDLHSNYHHLQV